MHAACAAVAVNQTDFMAQESFFIAKLGGTQKFGHSLSCCYTRTCKLGVVYESPSLDNNP